MYSGQQRILGVALGLGLVGLVGVAWAEPVRLHGTAAAARATGGHQKDEFGWGIAGFGAGELPLTRAFGLQLELGALWLSEGDPPADPNILPEGSSNAFTAGAGVRLRPFVGAYSGSPISAAGLWLSAAGGVATTGSEAVTGNRTRGMFDAFIGFDWLYRDMRFAIGPTVGYLHVFQSNDDLRPADANIVLIGLHAAYDTAPAPAQSRDGDRDGDGIKDSVDKCPDVPEDKDGFEDEDGCPDPDNDKDGLLDPVDKCPNEPEDKDGFEDEDGCPDPDNDQDGIPDAQDLCPNEPETKNNYADHDGCPDEEQVRVVGDKIVLDDRVHFRTNSHVIRPVSYPLLERLAKLIRDNPTYVHIDIEGHADERGPEWFNQKLSEDRAKAVLDFLVKQGVDSKRLSSKGFGTTRPLVEKSSEHAWLMNRRVEFRVTRESKVVGAGSAPAPAPAPAPGPSDVAPPADKAPAEKPPAGDPKQQQKKKKTPAPEEDDSPEPSGG